MQLRCVRAFGNFKPEHKDEDGNTVPADVVEVPDGAGFDAVYFEKAESEEAPVVENDEPEEEGN